jgi:hypothetical protein
MRGFVVVIAVFAVVGIGLVVEMLRRDEPMLGLAGLGVLTLDGVLGTTYGFLEAD